jgi:glycosyltransferase involved in cell wall biosynthesis
LANAAENTSYAIRVHSNAARTLLSPFWSRADLVHSVLPIFWHLWKKPLLLTVKGDYRIERQIWRKLYPIAIHKADRVTVPSVFLRDALELSKAVVIPNAIDVNRFTPHRESVDGILEFLAVTSFWFQEKAEGVVRMAKDLVSAMQGTNHSYRLTVLGDGPFLKSVSSRVQKLGIPVTFIGAAAPKPYYEGSDIFLYYSLHDNMPNAVLEAMASGLPIISNNIGAIPEMITHKVSGMIAADDNEYITCLRELASNENLRRGLGSAARKEAKSRFSWTTILPQYTGIYDELLA